MNRLGRRSPSGPLRTRYKRSSIHATTSAVASRRRTMRPDPWATRRASRGRPRCRSRVQLLLLLVLRLGKLARRKKSTDAPFPRSQYAFAGILIDKRYDEVAGLTHCTYATPFETDTFEIKGHFTCPPTAAAPHS
jgi:hypothetical protein